MAKPIFFLPPFTKEVVNSIAGKALPWQEAELNNFKVQYQPPEHRPDDVKRIMDPQWRSRYLGARCIVPEEGSTVRGIIYDADDKALARIAEYNFHGDWMELVSHRIQTPEGVVATVYTEVVKDRTTLRDIPEGYFGGARGEIHNVRLALSAERYRLTKEREQAAQKEGTANKLQEKK